MSPPPPRAWRSSLRMVLRRRRSSSSTIFRDTPTCSTVGMKTRETKPSSRRATLVSWGVLLTVGSLVMEGPFHEPSLAHPLRRTGWALPRGRAGAAAARAGRPAGLEAGGVVEEGLAKRHGN